jgi:hypothetical protein
MVITLPRDIRPLSHSHKPQTYKVSFALVRLLLGIGLGLRKGWVRSGSGKRDVDLGRETLVILVELLGVGAVLLGLQNLGMTLADGRLALRGHLVAVVPLGLLAGV